MVALTIICNGYRDFILPLSEEDVVVRNAVMAAAARHLPCAIRNGMGQHSSTIWLLFRA